MNLQVIAQATADHFGVTLETMRGYSRITEHCRPRHVYCAIASEIKGVGKGEIGRVIGRDHKTVKGSIARAAKLNVASDIAAIKKAACMDWHSIPFTTTRNTQEART